MTSEREVAGDKGKKMSCTLCNVSAPLLTRVERGWRVVRRTVVAISNVEKDVDQTGGRG